jgi:hypothetical protein
VSLASHRRLRASKNNRAVNKNERLTSLLREARSLLDEEQGQKIDTLLQEFENDTPPTSPITSTRSMNWPRSASVDMDHDSQAPNESQVSASVGSDQDLDYLDEDLLDERHPSETGYMGRNSQVRWMRTLHRKLDRSSFETSDSLHQPPGSSEGAFAKRSEALHARQEESRFSSSLSDYNFYLDNENLHEIEQVDPYAIPPLDTAKKLWTFYKRAVHDPVRILDDNFEPQLGTYYRAIQAGGTVKTAARWTAIMNLVFAIGARYSHLVGADWQADDHDHLVYMSRAVHFLGLKSMATLVCAPDKLLIQVWTTRRYRALH